MFNQVIISKSNLINNIKQVKSKNGSSKVCAMVKANAYGVGDVQVVRIIEQYVDFFGVACFFEAERIRKYTLKPILIMGAVEKEQVVKDFSYTCGSLDDIKFLISLNLPIKVHIKINSGMNRYGFKCFREYKKALKLIKDSKIIVEGIFTHFATTDDYVHKQMICFRRFVNLCFKFGFNPIIHADNSLVNEKYNHNLDMVRIGLSLYGRNENHFLPVLEIKSKIVEVSVVKSGEIVGYGYKSVAIHNMRVGIIPIGYADGFDSRYIGLKLNIDGKWCQVLNVCMDCFMIDITKTKLKKGDEIYVLDKLNSLNMYADHSCSSVYEVLTRFSSVRAERIINWILTSISTHCKYE